MWFNSFRWQYMAHIYLTLLTMNWILSELNFVLSVYTLSATSLSIWSFSYFVKAAMITPTAIERASTLSPNTLFLCWTTSLCKFYVKRKVEKHVPSPEYAESAQFSLLFIRLYLPVSNLHIWNGWVLFYSDGLWTSGVWRWRSSDYVWISWGPWEPRKPGCCHFSFLKGHNSILL